MTSPARGARDRVADCQASVPPPFFVDQGALRLDDSPVAGCIEVVSGVEALAVAAEQGLHLPHETLSAFQSCVPGVTHLTPAERGGLLRRLLQGARPAAKVDACLRCGVLQRLLPELERLRTMPRRDGLYKDVYVHTLRVLDAAGDDFLTRLAALLHDIAKPDTLIVEGGSARFPNHDLLGAERAARRLRGLAFEEAEVFAVGTLIRLHLRANSYEETWTDSAVRRLRLDAGEQWERLLALSHADVTSARGDVVARAHRRVADLDRHARSLDRPVEASPLDGVELMERFGLAPGRWIGLLKEQLLEALRSGRLEATDRDAAWALAEQYVVELNRAE